MRGEGGSRTSSEGAGWEVREAPAPPVEVRDEEAHQDAAGGVAEAMATVLTIVVATYKAMSTMLCSNTSTIWLPSARAGSSASPMIYPHPP